MPDPLIQLSVANQKSKHGTKEQNGCCREVVEWRAHVVTGQSPTGSKSHLTYRSLDTTECRNLKSNHGVKDTERVLQGSGGMESTHCDRAEANRTNLYMSCARPPVITGCRDS